VCYFKEYCKKSKKFLDNKLVKKQQKFLKSNSASAQIITFLKALNNYAVTKMRRFPS